MPWWVWIAVAVCVLTLAGGTAVAGVLTLRTWRAVRTSQRAVTGALEELARAADELDRRLAAIGERSEEVERRVAALNRSLEKIAVLRWALGDATEVVTRLRGAVPRK